MNTTTLPEQSTVGHAACEDLLQYIDDEFLEGGWRRAQAVLHPVAMGFTHAAVGALVRSSYRADRQALAVGVGGAVGVA